MQIQNKSVTFGSSFVPNNLLREGFYCASSGNCDKTSAKTFIKVVDKILKDKRKDTIELTQNAAESFPSEIRAIVNGKELVKTSIIGHKNADSVGRAVLKTIKDLGKLRKISYDGSLQPYEVETGKSTLDAIKQIIRKQKANSNMLDVFNEIDNLNRQMKYRMANLDGKKLHMLRCQIFGK